MNIQKCSKEDIFEYIDLQENDTILYLGGRIDDDNLYPTGYRKYLNSKIKELSPDKIICHNYWYAKKYYEKGILSEDTKIDMVLSYYYYFHRDGPLETINPEDYNGHRDWIKILIDKNPNMVYALYLDDNSTLGNRPPSVYVNDDWFGEDYDLNNVKYFDRDRRYSLSQCESNWNRSIRSFRGDKEYALLDHFATSGEKINSTGGFAMFMDILDSGFKNLNILGFTSFGSDEDQSHFTQQHPWGMYASRKYFDLKTSENQRVEADILKYLAQNNTIKNIENYEKLMSYLQDSN